MKATTRRTVFVTVLTLLSTLVAAVTGYYACNLFVAAIATANEATRLSTNGISLLALMHFGVYCTCPGVGVVMYVKWLNARDRIYAKDAQMTYHEIIAKQQCRVRNALSRAFRYLFFP